MVVSPYNFWERKGRSIKVKKEKTLTIFKENVENQCYYCTSGPKFGALKANQGELLSYPGINSEIHEHLKGSQNF